MIKTVLKSHMNTFGEHFPYYGLCGGRTDIERYMWVVDEQGDIIKNK